MRTLRALTRGRLVQVLLAAVLLVALGAAPAVGDGGPGFKGTFENFDPPPDSSHVLVTFGGVSPDGTLWVRVFDDGGTICTEEYGLDRFGERWPVSAQARGTMVSENEVEAQARVVCYTDAGPQLHPISPLLLGFVYDATHDVVFDNAGACFWRLGSGSPADCV
jgi:hypothetical protein